jgi:hypothetical protein
MRGNVGVKEPFRNGAALKEALELYEKDPHAWRIS